MGLSIQHAYSDDYRLDGPTSLTLATTVRPAPHIALSIVAVVNRAPNERVRRGERRASRFLPAGSAGPAGCEARGPSGGAATA